MLATVSLKATMSRAATQSRFRLVVPIWLYDISDIRQRESEGLFTTQEHTKGTSHDAAEIQGSLSLNDEPVILHTNARGLAMCWKSALENQHVNIVRRGSLYLFLCHG